MALPPTEGPSATSPDDSLGPAPHACETTQPGDSYVPETMGPSGLAGAPRFCGAASAGAKGRFGDYEIVRMLDKGGMGFVYEAVRVRLGLPVALKLIAVGRDATPADVDRFLEEVRAVASL